MAQKNREPILLRHFATGTERPREEVNILAQESNPVVNALDSSSPNKYDSEEARENLASIDADIVDTTTEAAAEEAADAAAEEAPLSAAETNTPNVIVPQPELGESLSQADNGATEGERREVEGGRAYEIIFITRAGNAEETEKSIARLREMIETEGGAIDTIRTSEVRRLAYAIKREIEGVYTVVNTRFATQHMAEIDRFFKLEESVLRHMILRDEM